MEENLPLSALLSQVLVTFTIEFDNEFERQMPHRTSNHGSTAGATRQAPWLVSMVMWTNFMQFIPAAGIPVRELQRRLRKTPKSLEVLVTRMSKWWGYVSVEQSVTGSRSKRIAPGALVSPTRGGLQAQVVWRPLAETIETRWRERFGLDKINQLKESLQAIVSQLDRDLPDGLPILGTAFLPRAWN
jgi:hypothetical protein